MSYHDKNVTGDGILARMARKNAAGGKRDKSRKKGAAGDPDPRSVTRGSFFERSEKNTKNPQVGKKWRQSDSDWVSRKQPPSPEEDTDAFKSFISSFFFDWFQFTVPSKTGGGTCQAGGPDEVYGLRESIDWATGQGLHEGRPSGGKNGYRVRLPLLDGPDGEALATLSSGSKTGIMPNISITGGEGACHELAESAKARWKVVRLSRADAACDVSQEGLWDALYEMAQGLAKENAKLGAVRVMHGIMGRTFYLGSPKSTVSLRVYEKGLERVAKGKASIEDIDRHLVRIEWTFRPQSRSKQGMSKLSPGQMIMTSVWARSFMARAAKITGITEGIVKPSKQKVEREDRQSRLEESAAHGARQYGRTFARMAVHEIVEERGETYAEAEISPLEIESRAAIIFGRLITGIGEKVALEERVIVRQTRDERTLSIAEEMAWMAVCDTSDRSDAIKTLAGAIEDVNGDDDPGAAAMRLEAAALLASASAERMAMSEAFGGLY